MMPRTVRHYHAAIAAVLTSACTTQVARTPCVTDADCAFADTPGCMAGVCTATSAGPPGCFSGQPQTALDVANQCPTVPLACPVPFDNCARLHLCDPGALADAFGLTIAPPAPTPPAVPVKIMPVAHCTDGAPTVIYLTGSPEVAPVIRAVQASLDLTPSSYRAVFLPQTSCQGAAAILDPSPAKHVIMNEANNWPFYYDANGLQVSCLLEDAGHTVDIGESDVDPSACGYAPVAGAADFTGPIRTAGFVVQPFSSSEDAISAEAAHLMFAAGGDGGLTTPWTNPAVYFLGGEDTTRLASPAIGAAPDGWWGTVQSPNDAFVSLLATDPALGKSAIGLFSGDVLDSRRGQLRELAVQRRGQFTGFLPDSCPDAFDKANVRDGHYSIWSAMHFLTSTTGGAPSPAASAFLMQLVLPKPDQALLSALIDASFIPACAMKVRQSPDGPVPSRPQVSCGCFYDQQATGHSTCRACATSADCPSSAPACNYGYCEAQ
jgi:hypothetical protein